MVTIGSASGAEFSERGTGVLFMQLLDKKVVLAYTVVLALSKVAGLGMRLVRPASVNHSTDTPATPPVMVLFEAVKSKIAVPVPTPFSTVSHSTKATGLASGTYRTVRVVVAEAPQPFSSSTSYSIRAVPGIRPVVVMETSSVFPTMELSARPVVPPSITVQVCVMMGPSAPGTALPSRLAITPWQTSSPIGATSGNS